MHYSTSTLEYGSSETRLKSPNFQYNFLCFNVPSSNCVKYMATLIKHTGDSDSIKLWKSLGICNFNKSSRQFLKSDKYGKCCFTSGLHSCQFLLTHIRIYPPGNGGGQRPHAINIFPNKQSASVKASLMPISPELHTSQAGIKTTIQPVLKKCIEVSILCL